MPWEISGVGSMLRAILQPAHDNYGLPQERSDVRVHRGAARLRPGPGVRLQPAIPRTTTAPSVLTDRHNIGASIQTENEYPISASQYPRFGTPTNIRRVSKKLPQTKTQTKRDF